MSFIALSFICVMFLMASLEMAALQKVTRNGNVPNTMFDLQTDCKFQPPSLYRWRLIILVPIRSQEQNLKVYLSELTLTNAWSDCGSRVG